jgi:hypothetical protein
MSYKLHDPETAMVRLTTPAGAEVRRDLEQFLSGFSPRAALYRSENAKASGVKPEAFENGPPEGQFP